MTRDEILDTAKELINGQRAKGLWRCRRELSAHCGRLEHYYYKCQQDARRSRPKARCFDA
jgi:hypothetical protein